MTTRLDMMWLVMSYFTQDHWKYSNCRYSLCLGCLKSFLLMVARRCCLGGTVTELASLPLMLPPNTRQVYLVTSVYIHVYIWISTCPHNAPSASPLLDLRPGVPAPAHWPLQAAGWWDGTTLTAALQTCRPGLVFYQSSARHYFGWMVTNSFSLVG